MKICWDNLENIYVSRKGNFRDRKTGNTYYIKICSECREEYLGRKNSKYCSDECLKDSNYFRESVSDANKGRHFTEDHKSKIGEKLKGINNWNYGRKGFLHPRNKGYYFSNNIPTYDTYAHQIDWIEEYRRNEEDQNILEVKCTYCGRWFIPSRISVHNRIQAINGQTRGESRFYCSDSCKKECPVYRKMPITLIKEDAVRAGRLNWIELNREVQPELRQLVLKRDEYTCQKCGSTEHLHCHHIKPVVDDPIESADVDNCITLCKGCHAQVHKLPGCGYNEIKICL